MTSDSSVQFDKRVTEDKISQRKSLNFYPTALFSAKPSWLSLLQKQKRCINFFISFLVCTTFAFAQPRIFFMTNKYIHISNFQYMYIK
jgi:hypothetical protein